MRAIIKCMVSTDETTKELVIHCDMDSFDAVVKKAKFVSIACHLPSVVESYCSKDYKDYFEITSDGDYHSLIEFKTNPESLRIYAQHHEGVHGCWNVIISGV